MRVVTIFAWFAIATAAPILPPDTSLATFPVAYYGANWNRTDENMEALSKISIVILLQKDGPCWLKCCPQAPEGGNQCGDARGSYHNSTALPGCRPECDQHGWQDSVFEQLKDRSRRSGRRPPHCMLYVNAVYDVPFNIEHALGDAIDVLDVHGQPHMENNDAGLFPFYMFDYGKPAARQAFLSIIERAVVNGSSDGVYVDCASSKGLRCDKTTSECIARRNGKTISLNEKVTPEQVAEYSKGKDETMLASSKLVGPSGTWFGNGAGSWKTSLPPFGENMMMMPIPDDAQSMIEQVRTGLQNFKYLIVGCENCYSNPKTETSALKSKCSESQIAAFLLALEPGAFLLCNGWDDKFALPLGLPKNPASQNPDTGAWSRTFAGGTSVTWLNGSGKVRWAVPTAPDSLVV